MLTLAWHRVRWDLAARGAARRHGGTREAVIVELRDGDDIGLGEAAPLPGMSRETIDDVVRELAGYRLGAIPAAPSLRFALDAARLDLAVRRAGTARATAIESAVVVDGADDARAATACVLKIKLGDDDDVERVTAIAAAAPATRLRLDANRAWSRDTARARIAALAPLASRIELIEEPCADTAELLLDGAGLPIRVALDESLAALDDAALDAALASPNLAALILKPTLLGLHRCIELAARARAHGKLAIVTHALEGPIGTAACVALARAIGGDVAHGLAPHAALAGWRALADYSLAGAIAAAPPDPALSITRAASDRLAIVTDTRSLTYADCAMRAVGPPARAIVATPSLATLHAIHAALEARQPLALLHHRLVPDELARQHEVVASARLPADTAFVLFTSGSTSAPRGVVLSRAAITAAADASSAHLGWRDGDRWLLALSLAHAGGLAIAVRCLVARRPLVLLDGDFDARRCATLLAAQRATIASLVPTQLAALLDEPAWRPPPALRAVLLGGAAAPPALVDAALARGVPVLATYGMTESFGQVATARVPGGPLIALPGAALAAGTADEPAPIAVRGEMLATCYLDGAAIDLRIASGDAARPASDALAIAPSFTTADLGAITGDHLVVAGRRDDVIITGGENVHPAQIEAALAATPSVRAAIAFGVADERWGQLVAAAIAVDPEFDAVAAAARWHAALPPHARPRRLAIAAALPQLPNGKLDRRAAAALPLADVTYAAER